MTALATVHDIDPRHTPANRLARFERILEHLSMIQRDAADVASYLEYGHDVDDLSLDLAADIAQIRALTGTAKQRTRQLITEQRARAARTSS